MATTMAITTMMAAATSHGQDRTVSIVSIISTSHAKEHRQHQSVIISSTFSAPAAQLAILQRQKKQQKQNAKPEAEAEPEA